MVQCQPLASTWAPLHQANHPGKTLTLPSQELVVAPTVNSVPAREVFLRSYWSTDSIDLPSSYPGSHSCCECRSATGLSCLGDTTSPVISHLLSGSFNLSDLFRGIPELYGEKDRGSCLTGVENLIVAQCLHFDRLLINLHSLQGAFLAHPSLSCPLPLQTVHSSCGLINHMLSLFSLCFSSAVSKMSFGLGLMRWLSR